MAISWLTVLQSVPWSDVISNAPKVADGAKKLWGSMGRKSGATAPAGSDLSAAEEQSIASLHARLLAVEAELASQHEQLLASSELIKELAEQNALLIARAEAARVRIGRLWISALLLGITAAAGVALHFIR
ncbi:hypothetical protein GBK02_06450 [Dechloromonas sp. TW-R-39-2]|uniref:hypothetical protein n=1 Tax=Dechloromonas sp. TW-R-39-2 TaxID=2654218 RepID=UPI00193DDD5F|nr:hypothetical protein [Dechloromonas sp. TW-R-39-2]QRM19059.1 hypothetical protein GBK02_06450 [Dechloromonas sp. TW-R-39-2]